jgi:hypothetical protein
MYNNYCGTDCWNDAAIGDSAKDSAAGRAGE